MWRSSGRSSPLVELEASQLEDEGFDVVLMQGLVSKSRPRKHPPGSVPDAVPIWCQP